MNIQKLVDAVVDTQLSTWDNPNGGIVYTCPFCGATKETKATETVTKFDLEHDEDCAYNLAIDINYELSESSNQ